MLTQLPVRPEDPFKIHKETLCAVATAAENVAEEYAMVARMERFGPDQEAADRASDLMIRLAAELRQIAAGKVIRVTV